MTLKVNKEGCGCGGACDTSRVATSDQHHLHGHLSSGAKRTTFLGQEHLVVPLIMLKETVVNGGLVTLSELKPHGWNGVPVTIGHPNVRGVDVTANSPEIIEAWQVGRIFNAELVGDKLKAEAWIEVAKAEQKYPGIIGMLEGGAEMDVSTGYFSKDEYEIGVFKGMPYFEVHRDIKPDHLALLPNDEGACSWADGCGVRANRRESLVTTNKDDPKGEAELAGIRRLFAAIGKPAPATNRRGNDDDYRQMIADLISNDESPFVPDDEFALREMSLESLKDVRDKYLPSTTKTNQKGGPAMANENEGAGAEANKAKAPVALTAESITEIVNNAVKEALSSSVEKAVDTALNANKRAELIGKIHEASSVDKEELEKLSTNALEAMAPKSQSKPADYSGKGMRTNGDDGNNVTKYPGMFGVKANAEGDDKQKKGA